MDRKAVCAALAPALILYACDRGVIPDDEAAATPAVETVDTVGTPGVDPVPSPPPPVITPPVADRANDGFPDLAPPALTAEAERTAKGARNVLLSFARAIELREYDQAWALLSPGDKRKWSKSAFARQFADLGKITVAVPEGTMEGAAGSAYYTVPVTITANDAEGRPVRIEGEAVLRRVNDVDGATPLRWHFDKMTLDWTH
jgi:hypothetical protein